MLKKVKLLLLFFVILVYILTIFIWPLRNLDERLFDYFMPTIVPHQSIVVVEIDEKSLNELGQWPWDREIYSQFLSKVTSTKPVVIAFDIFLSESVADQDEILGNALQIVGTSTELVWAAKLEDGELLLPISEILSTSDTGYGNVDTDSTGLIRYYKLFTSKYDSLAYQIIDNYFAGQVEEIDEMERIHFVDDYEKFQSMSFVDLLYGDTEIDLKDKILVVGVVVEDVKVGINDNFIAANTGDYIPGVYLHANMVNTILQNEQFKEVSTIVQILCGVIFMIIIFLVTEKLKTWRKLFPLFILPVYFLISILVYQYNWMSPIVYPLLVSIILWTTLFTLDYILQYRESLRVKRAFSQYVGSHILDKLTDIGDRLLKPGGVENDVIVMFSDIIGFTSISEKLQPQELVMLINAYLTAITDVIISNDGVIDKYIGDNVMAFWGAPVEDDKMCTKACKSVIEMQGKIAKFNENFIKQLMSEKGIDARDIKLVSGIGMNFGRVIVGNLGSSQKFDYTVMGDNVNLASRIEGLTRKYECKNLISENVIERLKCEGFVSEFLFRFVDEIIVKGRKNSVKIYELLGLCEEKNYSKNIQLIKQFEEALDLYRSKKFDIANREFKRLYKEGDKTSRVFVQRIEQLKNDKKLLSEFNGVWKWEEK